MTSRELDEARAAAGAEVRARQGRLASVLAQLRWWWSVRHTARELMEETMEGASPLHARLECGKAVQDGGGANGPIQPQIGKGRELERVIYRLWWFLGWW